MTSEQVLVTWKISTDNHILKSCGSNNVFERADAISGKCCASKDDSSGNEHTDESKPGVSSS